MTASTRHLSEALADRYCIERELGAGGMATVYLAHDLKHERKVALKVLRPELAAVIGAERFLHEITTTANLQHPHILGLHDSGQVDGTVFYVMPFVAGESLRDRLDREKQLPVEDAVRIAREVASALDYAHRHKVIHRDIKPENILLHEGSALVADFGIALAASNTGGSRMTETGMSLGTPHYMSPEQAMGERELSARSDVYALGCVLYEMLAGEPPFTGPTPQSIVARVVTEEPRPLRLQRKTIPPHIDASVQRALQKLPADRFATGAEFAQALADSAAGARVAEPQQGGGTTIRGRRSATLPLAAALILAVALASWAWLRPVPSPRVTRFAVVLENSYDDSEDPPTVSPDGRLFAFTNDAGTLSLREEGVLGSKAIGGAENSWSPFFSPDGSMLGFTTGFPGDLKVMNLASGAIATVVKDSALGYGASWSNDGWIYYTAGYGRRLMRVRPGGGTAELVFVADSIQDAFAFRWPEILPDGKRLLLAVWRRRGQTDIVLLDLAANTTRVVTQGLRAWFLPSGHLVTVKGNGSVTAAVFELRTGAIRGQPVELVSGVAVKGGTPQFALSRNGTVMYKHAQNSSRLMRVEPNGHATAVDPSWTGLLGWPSVSSDGSRMAISSVVEGRREVWVKTLPAGPFHRVAAAGSQSYRSSWSNDGRWVVFISDVSGVSGLYRASADGTGGIEQIMTSERGVDEGFWSPDGSWLVYRSGSGGGRDIHALRPGIDSAPIPLVTSEAEEYSPTLSPDGRWLAYGSDASGRDEVFVRPFPETSRGRWQVSIAGGTEPLWSPDGRQLFYRSDNHELVSVAFDAASDFRIVSRRSLFSTRQYQRDTRNRAYSIGPDGVFYFVQHNSIPTKEVVLIHNWLEELRAKVPR